MEKHIKNDKKLVILGKLPTKYNCPYLNDKTWEKWSMGMHKDMSVISQYVDKWFDLHITPENDNDDTVKLKDFPLKELEDMVGGQYFNNISAILIAYAVYLGYTHIYLAGMQFIDDTEGYHKRQKQYNNVREMIFFAKGKGLTIDCYDDIILKEYNHGENEDYDG